VPLVVMNGLPVPNQGVAKCPGGRHVGVDRTHEVAGTHRLVLEGEMDDAVGLQAAAVAKLSRSSRSPRRTSAPMAATAWADVSERARPTTWWPCVEKFGDDGGGDMA